MLSHDFFTLPGLGTDSPLGWMRTVPGCGHCCWIRPRKTPGEMSLWKVFSLRLLLRGRKVADASRTHTGPLLEVHQRVKSGCECWRNAILSLSGRKKSALCSFKYRGNSIRSSAGIQVVVQKSSPGQPLRHK